MLHHGELRAHVQSSLHKHDNAVAVDTTRPQPKDVREYSESHTRHRSLRPRTHPCSRCEREGSPAHAGGPPSCRGSSTGPRCAAGWVTPAPGGAPERAARRSRAGRRAAASQNDRSILQVGGGGHVVKAAVSAKSEWAVNACAMSQGGLVACACEFSAAAAR
jgi:hypothetical protein